MKPACGRVQAGRARVPSQRAGMAGTAAGSPRECVAQYSISLTRERWLDPICRHARLSSLEKTGPRRAT